MWFGLKAMEVGATVPLPRQHWVQYTQRGTQVGIKSFITALGLLLKAPACPGYASEQKVSLLLTSRLG